MTPVPSSPIALLDQLDELRAKALTIRSAYPSLPVLQQKGADVEAVWSDGADMTWIECEEEDNAALIVAAVNALPQLAAALRAVLELCNTAERDVSELLGLRAGLRIASNVGSDDIRTAITAALSVTR